MSAHVFPMSTRCTQLFYPVAAPKATFQPMPVLCLKLIAVYRYTWQLLVVLTGDQHCRGSTAATGSCLRALVAFAPS